MHYFIAYDMGNIIWHSEMWSTPWTVRVSSKGLLACTAYYAHTVSTHYEFRTLWLARL